MKTFFAMLKRNIKVFFKDKALFFTSLITPVILLVLYATFLARVYRERFVQNVPKELLNNKLVNGMVGGELFSSLLAVCCVTVAFCSNMLMVQDKVNGVKKDFVITPIKKSTLALSYYFGSLVSTLIISLVAAGASFVYIAISGWYISVGDVFLILLDVFLLSLFGTVLSSIINVFLSSNGQVSAVGTIVSAGYGFVCGAYMPLSSFGTTLRNILGFLPGTYGTSLIRNHALNGVYREMAKTGYPADVIESIKDSVDCNLYFFGNKVSIGAMYGILIGTIVVLIGAYVLINVFRKKKI